MWAYFKFWQISGTLFSRKYEPICTLNREYYGVASKERPFDNSLWVSHVVISASCDLPSVSVSTWKSLSLWREGEIFKIQNFFFCQNFKCPLKEANTKIQILKFQLWVTNYIQTMKGSSQLSGAKRAFGFTEALSKQKQNKRTKSEPNLFVWFLKDRMNSSVPLILFTFSYHKNQNKYFSSQKERKS